MASLREEQAKVSTASLAILATVAVAGVLYVTQSVMVPFVLALFIASVVSPIVDYLVLRMRVPHTLAVSLALLVVLVLVGIFALIVVYAGQQMIATAGQYVANVDQLADKLETEIGSLFPNLDTDRFHAFVGRETNKLIGDLKTRLPGLLTHTFGRTVSLFTTVSLVTIFVVFLLAGRDPHVLRKGMPAEIDQKIRGYLSTKVILSGLTGVLVWVTLTLLGLELAPVFGLLAFMLNFIPSIGSIIATMLPIPIAVAQFGGDIGHLLAVIAIPGAIQMGIGNGLEPKLMGNELKLHPVTIVLALSFWGLLWGMIGMLLAVPITAIVRLVLMRFATTRAAGDLLAGELAGGGSTAATA